MIELNVVLKFDFLLNRLVKFKQIRITNGHDPIIEALIRSAKFSIRKDRWKDNIGRERVIIRS